MIYDAKLAICSLEKWFGYSEFRPDQEPIVRAVVEGHDVFVGMPTGFGKSLCFQLPCLIRGGLSVVISPMISLQNDQVQTMRQHGIQATCLHSELSGLEYDDRVAMVRRGQCSMLYLSPEKLQTASILDLICECNVQIVIVDEAHCISQWGPDFRASYRHIPLIRARIPSIQMVAFTATATKVVASDIVSNLQLNTPKMFVGTIDRPNLFYRVVAKTDGAYAELYAHLLSHRQSTIVYRTSKKGVDEFTALCVQRGIRAMAYHADMSKADKKATYTSFMMNTCDVVVATVAFGMGIDKPDVRFVIHLDVPTSVENYVQETGRAGRDGKDSECILYFSKTDCARKTFALTSDAERASFARMVKFSETTTCRRAFLHDHFEQTMPTGPCTKCDNCHSVVWDIENQTANATHILQCIIEFRQRQFGANYIVDVLRGAQLSKIKANQHTTIASFGQCRTQPKALLLDVVSRLIECGYLSQTPGKYTVCSVTPSGRAFLGSKEPFLIKKRQTTGMIHNSELRARLLHYRTQQALMHQVAPHSILSEPTIDALVSTPIHSTSDLQKITGMSEIKLAMFGTELLKLIREDDELAHHPAMASHCTCTTTIDTTDDGFADDLAAPSIRDTAVRDTAIRDTVTAPTKQPTTTQPPTTQPTTTARESQRTVQSETTGHVHVHDAAPRETIPPHCTDAMVAIHTRTLQSHVDDGRLTETQALECVDQYARAFPSMVATSFAVDDVDKRRALCRLFCEHGTKHIDDASATTHALCTRLELRMFAIWWTDWNGGRSTGQSPPSLDVLASTKFG